MAQRLTWGGNGDSDCVLTRMGLQREVLLARQLREYPARPEDIEANFEWANKTGNVRSNIGARSCRLLT